MKIILFIFICFFSLNTFAYKESYNVRGIDENGIQVIGTIYTNDQSWEVKGQLTDENGNIQDFNGRWNGRDQVTGETEEGYFLDLNID